jgi:predicted nucleic acid-binding protein
MVYDQPRAIGLSMIVISDTSPILYLVLIDQIELLPQLYQRILVPETVRDEMIDAGAPLILRQWILAAPHWLEVCTVQSSNQPALERLDPGEKAAIELAQQINADLLILDDRAGRQAALNLGLKITGLLGILKDAETLGLIDLPKIIDRLLTETNFRVSPKLIKHLLQNNRP